MFLTFVGSAINNKIYSNLKLYLPKLEFLKIARKYLGIFRKYFS